MKRRIGKLWPLYRKAEKSALMIVNVRILVGLALPLQMPDEILVSSPFLLMKKVRYINLNCFYYNKTISF